MYNNEKHDDVFKQEQQNIIKRLNEAGIKVSLGKRVPHAGSYSGIVGNRRKVLHVDFAGVYFTGACHFQNRENDTDPL